VYFNFGLTAVIGVLFPIGGSMYLGEQLAGNWWWFGLLAITLFAIGIFMLLQLRTKNIQKVFYGTIAFIIAVMCFGMPMASALTSNPQYKGLSQLAIWEAENEIRVYEFEAFTPELVWDYGNVIPMIYTNTPETLPKEERFGVLVSEDRISHFKKAFSAYELKKITRYDMNPQAPGDRSHRPRLWRDLYLVVQP